MVLRDKCGQLGQYCRPAKLTLVRVRKRRLIKDNEFAAEIGLAVLRSCVERLLLPNSDVSTACKTMAGRPDQSESILPLTMLGAVAKIRGTSIVGPIDLTIDGTGMTVVMGPNGSGKTTLLRLMHGLQRVSVGSVSWAKDDETARKRQAYVFQTPIMMRRYVVDNIAFPLVVHGMKKHEAKARAIECAKRFGLGHVLHRPAPVLSGGEKQKLALARAMIRQPEILFLDEPCANLDGRATREIEALLLEAQAQGTRIVMATHDMGQARRLASDVVFLLEGKLHEMAPAAAFFKAAETKEARAFLKGDIVG